MGVDTQPAKVGTRGLSLGDSQPAPGLKVPGTTSRGGPMTTLDHVGFAVADYARSKAFYEKALAPLGMKLLMEFSGAAAGFGRDDGRRPSFFIEAHGEPV